MPYGQRRLVGVHVAGIPGLIYGFRTDVADTTSTVLGHVDALNSSGDYIAGVIFGINSPKPATARKYFGADTKAYESSFVDPQKIDDARAAGWKVKPGKRLKLRSTKYSKLVYVEQKIVDEAEAQGNQGATSAVTIKYCWRIPAYQYAKLLDSDKTMLGIKDVTDNDLKTIVVGANSNKPYKASKLISADGQLLRISTFVASNKIDNLANGWA